MKHFFIVDFLGQHCHLTSKCLGKTYNDVSFVSVHHFFHLLCLFILLCERIRNQEKIYTGIYFFIFMYDQQIYFNPLEVALKIDVFGATY